MFNTYHADLGMEMASPLSLFSIPSSPLAGVQVDVGQLVDRTEQDDEEYTFADWAKSTDLAQRIKVARGNRTSHFCAWLVVGLYVAGATSLILLLSMKFDVDRHIAIERLDQLTKIVPPEDTVYNIHNATVTFKLPAILAYLVGLPIPPKPTGNITAVLPYFDQNSTQTVSVTTQWVRTNLYSQGQSLFVYQPLWIMMKSMFCGRLRA
jgi:hypothetical protein